MERNNIDISKVNEAIKIIRGTCVRYQYCSEEDIVCPFYNKKLDECSFNISANPDGWDLINEGDIHAEVS